MRRGQQVRHGRTDHDRAAAEPPGEQGRGLERIGGAAEQDDQPVALHAGELVKPRPAGEDPQLVEDDLGFCRVGMTDHGDHR